MPVHAVHAVHVVSAGNAVHVVNAICDVHAAHGCACYVLDRLRVVYMLYIAVCYPAYAVHAA